MRRYAEIIHTETNLTNILTGQNIYIYIFLLLYKSFILKDSPTIRCWGVYYLKTYLQHKGIWYKSILRKVFTLRIHVIQNVFITLWLVFQTSMWQSWKLPSINFRNRQARFLDMKTVNLNKLVWQCLKLYLKTNCSRGVARTPAEI